VRVSAQSQVRVLRAAVILQSRVEVLILTQKSAPAQRRISGTRRQASP